MLMEERYHLMHGRSWLRSGIDSAPLDRAWREAIEWFGPPDGEVARLHSEGKLGMGPTQLRARMEEQLEAPAPNVEIAWRTWDPVRRRGRPGAIDAHTFGMLRGLEEKKYAPPTAKQTAS
jgi:1,2-phenylacetyl-CoA epoxidase catalytic subunit